ncbi:hypothetical protein EX30DRAFT_342564 [Ascodesmis nigricans]|uniref:Uncharacterized protein n=1 Tax=Ascodesmis nigricans TaxID=341454 RepID=A0A4S2MSS3_9PEZI|nr:hypothetical protein EX30DRAFT_342564 [Ascodesmis nigricans]
MILHDSDPSPPSSLSPLSVFVLRHFSPYISTDRQKSSSPVSLLGHPSVPEPSGNNQHSPGERSKKAFPTTSPSRHDGSHGTAFVFYLSPFPGSGE